MELYCKTCAKDTNHKFMGNFKNGSRMLGRYLCIDCGTERNGEDTASLLRRGVLIKKPRVDWTDEEIEAWDQYAHRLADEIAYNRFVASARCNINNIL